MDVSQATTPAGLVCLGFSTVANEVTLGGGVIGAEMVKIENVRIQATDTDFDRTTSVVTSMDATLISTEPVCPASPEFKCVRNGTILNIETFIPCGSAVCPMGYVVDQNPTGKTTIALVLHEIGVRPDLP